MAPVPPFNVHVAGFGSFAGFETENPSYQAVKMLKDEVISSPPAHLTNDSSSTRSNDSPGRTIHITVEEVPVTYEAVLRTVPPLHHLAPSSLSTPAFPQYDAIIHVGVAGSSNMIRLEGLARKFSYNSLDFDKKLCEGEVDRRGFVSKEWEGSEEVLKTVIDRADILQWCKTKGVESITTSQDAGLYLCEYIYYCSLACAQRRKAQTGEENEVPVLFIHVPPVNTPYTIAQLSQILRLIIWRVLNGDGGEKSEHSI